MNRKKIRANKRKRRYCHSAHTTRQSNGLPRPKVIYDTEEEAWEAIRSSTKGAVQTIEELTPYICRATGDHYHIGRAAKRADTSQSELLETLSQIPGAAKILRSSRATPTGPRGRRS